MDLPEPPTPMTAGWLEAAHRVGTGETITVRRHRRIGEAFGLAGVVYRVEGSDGTVAIKVEAPEATARAARFLERIGRSDAVPALIGSWVGRDFGVLVTAMVEPAEQGDVLAGCDADRGAAVLRALARVHGSMWGGGLPDDFPGTVWETDRWHARVEVGAARLPDVLTPDRVDWLLGGLPDTLGPAMDRLHSGPHAAIQLDSHLDNVLWRDDGSAVLVDWSRACNGPPAMDLAGLMIGGLGTQSLHPYREELLRMGVTSDEATAAVDRISDALLAYVQPMVGWVGRTDIPEPEPGSRVDAMRRHDLETVLRLVAPA